MSNVTAAPTSSADTQRLRCTSVRKPMRRPFKPGGNPATGAATRVNPRAWRPSMNPYAPPPATAAMPVAASPVSTARREMPDISLKLYSTPLQNMTNLYDELSWRGLVADATEGLADRLSKESITAYIGLSLIHISEPTRQ